MTVFLVLTLLAIAVLLSCIAKSVYNIYKLEDMRAKPWLHEPDNPNWLDDKPAFTKVPPKEDKKGKK